MKKKYSEVRHLETLLLKYPNTPSFALVRTPEVDYLANKPLTGRVLDHCCGDGFLAHMIWPEGIAAGVDFSRSALETASRLKSPKGEPFYGQLEEADVSKQLPFESDTFEFVINNSGLEHVQGLDSTLREINRVLKPGGQFVFTLAGKRAFDMWPADIRDQEKQEYIKVQPYHNILNLDQWREALSSAGLEIVDYESHFDEEETKRLFYYDYHHSMKSFKNKPLPTDLKLLRFFRPLGRMQFKKMLLSSGYESYPNMDQGSFYCISAQKNA